MLCSYCKVPLESSGKPCPNCGMLPSPQAPVGDIWGKTGSLRNRAESRKATPDFQKKRTNPLMRAQQMNFPESQSPQMDFPNPLPTIKQDAPPFTTSAHLPSARGEPRSDLQPTVRGSGNSEAFQDTDKPRSLLPVPYQPTPPADPSPTMSLQLISERAIEHLLPAMPNIVHVPPIYKNERSLTPKYRVVSGLLSVIIVALFVCGGATYYAQASGKLSFLQQFYGETRPPSIQPMHPPQLPDPPDKIDTGPAYNTIPSAATASRIDPKTKLVMQADKKFAPGQTFYLAFNIILPSSDGHVSTKWYTNNQYFTTVLSKDLIKAGSNVNGSVSIAYPQAAEGSVEIYWNDQLAQKLYFVVR